MLIYSIIVCYHPDISSLSLLCNTLIKSNSRIVLIDNTEKSALLSSKIITNIPDIAIKIMGENTGVAYAQNIGIKYSIEHGADVIVIFDQDSIISENLLSLLLGPITVGEPKIVAPVIIDKKKEIEYPSFTLNKYNLPKKVFSSNKYKPYNVDIVIASGSAATRKTFELAGMMDERFFIDFVDTEWCLRCRKKNIPIQVVPQAVMKHSIGKNDNKKGLLKWHIHPPIRLYYQIRNALLLLRNREISFLFSLREIISIYIHQVLLIFLLKGKKDYVRNHFWGVVDGILGKVGKRKDY